MYDVRVCTMRSRLKQTHDGTAMRRGATSGHPTRVRAYVARVDEPTKHLSGVSQALPEIQNRNRKRVERRVVESRRPGASRVHVGAASLYGSLSRDSCLAEPYLLSVLTSSTNMFLANPRIDASPLIAIESRNNVPPICAISGTTCDNSTCA